MNNRSGFTLLEMMVVIGLMAILSAIMIPNVISYRGNQQVTRAAREIYSALQVAKMTAIRDNTTISTQLTSGTGTAGTYQIFEDLDGDGVFSAGDRNIEAGQMPPAVNVSDGGGGNNYFAGNSSVTAFSPMGLTTGRNGTVWVTNLSGTRTHQVVVNTVGGIRVQ
jgi:type IV fimbrial biogenesis protein FimT